MLYYKVFINNLYGFIIYSNLKRSKIADLSYTYLISYNFVTIIKLVMISFVDKTFNKQILRKKRIFL